MKNKYPRWSKRTLLIFTSLILVTLAVFSRAIQPAVEFFRQPVYTGNTAFPSPIPAYDPAKKTVVIMADKDGTEMFDMMAPFYLFNNTQQANVYIIAEKSEPIVVRKGIYILPQLSFRQLDSMGITVDVIVVPNQSIAVGMKQKRATVNFIKEHYNGLNCILAVCDGSATVAATGLYDGKPLTTHSSDWEPISKQYTKPMWVHGVRVTQYGNLYSTAGVSNATEGSLTVIMDLLGPEVMKRVLNDVHYPASEIMKGHRNELVTADALFIAVKKGAFKSNAHVGVLLKDGINEFELAGLLDTYTRSFPASIETFTTDGKPVTSKYGLTILPTGNITANKCTELHVLNTAHLNKQDEALFPETKIIRYDSPVSQYIIDVCLQRIEGIYGRDFAHTVKLMLDYN